MLNRQHIRPHSSGLLIIPLLLFMAACSTTIPGITSPSPPVEISGLNDQLRKNVLAVMTPPLSLPNGNGHTLARLRQLARRAPQMVALALEPYGYYASATTTRVAGKTLYLNIDPGRPVQLTRVELALEGSSSPQLQQQLEKFPLAEGDILLHDVYESGKAKLISAAEDLGYLDAHFSRHTVRVDPRTYSAEIELTLNSGPLYRVGELRFEGAANYPHDFLRRYMTLETGTPLTHADLAASQQQLRGSDRFRRVRLSPQLGEIDAHDQVPIIVRLEAEARRQLRPGIGYGTDTGARFSLRYRDLNAFEQGHEFLADALLSEFRHSLTADYTFPGNNLDTRTILRGGFEGEDVDSYETRYLFSEIEQLWGLGKRRIVSTYVRYQRESSDIGAQSVTSGFLLGGLRYRQGRVDSPIRPRSGYHLSLELRGSDESLLSDVSLVQILGGARFLAPLGKKLLLHLRGNAGATLQENEFDEIPASLRFFAGGDRSVRGYAYQALGPEDRSGDVTGGKNLLVGSCELEWRLLKSWGIAGFYDTGNAFNSFSDMQLAEAVGVGMRYYSFAGPVWLDVARTVDTPDPDYRLHFGLGITW